jgi:hypothetical protein
MVRLFIGVIARLIVWACVAVIVGDAVVTMWDRANYVLMVAALCFFPATVFIWPWTHSAFGVSLIFFYVIGAVAYPISTVIGGLDPI